MGAVLAAPFVVGAAVVAIAIWRIARCGTRRDLAVLGALGAVLLVGAFIAGAFA